MFAQLIGASCAVNSTLVSAGALCARVRLRRRPALLGAAPRGAAFRDLQQVASYLLTQTESSLARSSVRSSGARLWIRPFLTPLFS